MKTQKYLSYNDLRISYKPGDDSIHITTGDPRLSAQRFHLTLTQGTSAEKILRQQLTEAGLIKPKSKIKTAKETTEAPTVFDKAHAFEEQIPVAYRDAFTFLPGFINLITDYEQHKPSIALVRGGIGHGKTYNSFATLRMLIRRGSVQPSEILTGTEASLLGRIAAAGFNRSELLGQLRNPEHRIIFIDDVGGAHYASKTAKHEVWLELVAHAIKHNVLLLLTLTEKTEIEEWVGSEAYKIIAAHGRVIQLAPQPPNINFHDNISGLLSREIGLERLLDRRWNYRVTPSVNNGVTYYFKPYEEPVQLPDNIPYPKSKISDTVEFPLGVVRQDNRIREASWNCINGHLYVGDHNYKRTKSLINNILLHIASHTLDWKVYHYGESDFYEKVSGLKQSYTPIKEELHAHLNHMYLSLKERMLHVAKGGTTQELFLDGDSRKLLIIDDLLNLLMAGQTAEEINENRQMLQYLLQHGAAYGVHVILIEQSPEIGGGFAKLCKSKIIMHGLKQEQQLVTLGFTPNDEGILNLEDVPGRMLYWDDDFLLQGQIYYSDLKDFALI